MHGIHLRRLSQRSAVSWFCVFCWQEHRSNSSGTGPIWSEESRPSCVFIKTKHLSNCNILNAQTPNLWKDWSINLSIKSFIKLLNWSYFGILKLLDICLTLQNKSKTSQHKKNKWNLKNALLEKETTPLHIWTTFEFEFEFDTIFQKLKMAMNNPPSLDDFRIVECYDIL